MASDGSLCSVQFNMVSMCLEKPICARPCFRSFPNIVCLIDGGPLSSFQGRSFSISSFHTSLLQAVGGVMSLALCLQVVSQVSQHFRSSEKQATCEGFFARQSSCLFIYFHSSMSRAVHPQAHWICEDDGMCCVTVTCWDNPAEGMGNSFHLHCQAGGWNCIGSTVFMNSNHNLLDSEAPPWLVFGDWAISVHYEVLCFAVFLNEKLDLWLCFACWPFSTVLSQVFWQECLVEMSELVWVPFPVLGLLELCQLACLQYWVLCVWPIQDLPRPSLHPFVSFTASWSGLWGFFTALKYALTCSTFCLVCIGGRSSINLMVSAGVSLVVLSMTYIALFCTLSTFSRFVCAVVLRPSP